MRSYASGNILRKSRLDLCLDTLLNLEESIISKSYMAVPVQVKGSISWSFSFYLILPSLIYRTAVIISRSFSG